MAQGGIPDYVYLPQGILCLENKYCLIMVIVEHPGERRYSIKVNHGDYLVLLMMGLCFDSVE